MRRLLDALVRRFWLLLVGWSPPERLWDLVSRTGITVFVGPNGSGKSLAAVASRLPVLDGIPWTCFDPAHRHHEAFRLHAAGCSACTNSTWLRLVLVGRDEDGEPDLCPVGNALLAAGAEGNRLVYSTVELTQEQGLPHANYRPLRDYQQLLTIEHADVLFDEVAGVSDSSDSASIPVQVVNWLHQLRKRDVRLVVTTPAYARCSKPIRQVAQVVVDARSFAAEPAEAGRLWRPRRAFVFRAFDAFDFEDYTAGTKERLKPLCTAAFWRPGHRAETAYNTLGQVLALGHVNDHGMCMVCGGQRRRPTCACEGHVADGVEVQVVEKVSAAGARTRQAIPLSAA